MILIRKRTILVIFLIFSCILSFRSLLRQTDTQYHAAMAEAELSVPSSFTVIIDPGHGGQDGGAVSPDGVRESHINLDIAFRVRDLMAFAGQGSKMSRTEDISIHSPGAARWKASDLQNRVKLANETQNAILLSIHQNSLPSSPITHGAQVFHTQQIEATTISAAIQTALNEVINIGNEKQMKPAPKGVYLMKHILVPGILVECGFLSNEAETTHLQKTSHQIKLAAAITAGYLRGIGENST